MYRLCIGLILVILAFLSIRVDAQEDLRLPGGPPSLPPLPQLEERPLPPQPPPSKVLPPIPLPPAEQAEPLPLPRVLVREIRVSGSTVFSAEELAAVTAPYINRELTAEDLEEIRLALTRFYVERGYVTSGAILPDQTVTEGVITFHMIEGELDRIEITDNKWFQAGYIRRRLALGATPPVNINALQRRLQLLQQDDRIERLNAELRPGVQLGKSELHLRVEDRIPFYVALEFNNHQSPTVGAERGLISVAHRNLTGNGDILSVTYGRSSGLDLQLDASYTLPLTARDTTGTFRYSRNETIVVEGVFADLDIESRSETFELALRHPFYRTLQREFAVELMLARLDSETFFLGDEQGGRTRFFSPQGTDTAVRISQEWLDRTQNQVLAMRSRFSVGVDILGAKVRNSIGQDEHFFVWLGQFQYARRLTDWDLQTILRLDLQLSNDPLLPLEQIAVGGRFSVRGYRENQLVRDNGLIFSIETRVPLVRNKPWADFIHLAPFIDFGHGWNSGVPTPSPTKLASLGVGLRWALTLPVAFPLRSQFEIYWGYPLIDVDTEGGDLQDLGLHLQFVIAAF
jgi:hemolysin activation/secretion protein